jgi:hypothetical protein
MTSRTEYSTQTPKKSTRFSGQYLRNHWTLDTGVLGYFRIVWPKEHSPEVRSFPPGTPCISFNKKQRVSIPSFKILSLFSAPSGEFRARTAHGRKLVARFFLIYLSVVHYTTLLVTSCGSGSSVSIATAYELDGPAIESRCGGELPPVQTGPGTHPWCCKMGTGSLQG